MNLNDRLLIVVGVDGSAASDHALAWTLRLAHRVDTAVEIITAWSPELDTPAGSPAMPLADPVQAERVQRDCVERVLPGLSHPRSVAMQVVEGAPGPVLTETARRADLLVLASHGHRKLYTILMGSTSEYCIRHGTCPVTVIPVPVHDPGAHPNAVATKPS